MTVVLGGIVFWTKPWTDDFSKLKTLLKISPHPFKGDFKLITSAKLNAKAQCLLAEKGKSGVIIRFYPDGRVILLSDESEKSPLLKGRFRIDRDKIELYALKSSKQLPTDDVKFTFESLSNAKVHLERPDKELWVVQKLSSAENLELKWKKLFTAIEKESISE